MCVMILIFTNPNDVNYLFMCSMFSIFIVKTSIPIFAHLGEKAKLVPHWVVLRG